MSGRGDNVNSKVSIISNSNWDTFISSHNYCRLQKLEMIDLFRVLNTEETIKISTITDSQPVLVLEVHDKSGDLIKYKLSHVSDVPKVIVKSVEDRAEIFDGNLYKFNSAGVQVYPDFFPGAFIFKGTDCVNLAAYLIVTFFSKDHRAYVRLGTKSGIVNMSDLPFILLFTLDQASMKKFINRFSIINDYSWVELLTLVHNQHPFLYKSLDKIDKIPRILSNQIFKELKESINAKG
jgi:hypothetical protein